MFVEPLAEEIDEDLDRALEIVLGAGMTLLDRLRSRRDEMTNRERQIAGYLETGYPHAGLETATAVGERVNASAATVVRFIAKLGYSGYADFQRELRDEVEARLISPLQRLTDPATAGTRSDQDGSGDVLARSFEAAMSAVTRTFGALDRRSVETVASLLTGCRGRIWIVGEKKGRSIALYLYAQLNLCLERVSLGADASFEADRLLDVGPDDIVVLLDVRRYVETTLLTADWCEARGATLVVLSDSAISPLFGRTPYRLAAATGGAGAFDTYVGLMLIADVLTNAVTAIDPDRARRRLELGEAAWAQFKVFAPHGEAVVARPQQNDPKSPT